MTLTEGLLVAIVVVLMFIVLTRNRGGCLEEKKKTWDCIDRASGRVTSVEMQYAHKKGCSCPNCTGTTPEKESLKNNAEYFTSCGDSPDVRQDTGCDDKFAYAVNDFGAPGLTYVDWVTSQSVDPQVIKNHSDFTKDRIGGSNPQNITGKTFSPDSHDSYNFQPWVGLRRPQAVSQCNPTQVPDFSPDLFDKKPGFTWTSSQS